MKFSHKRPVITQLFVLISTFAILTTQTAFALAATESRAAAGEITVSGTATKGEKPAVLVNGEPAFTGRTFFSGGTITTESNSATVDFGKLGRIVLGPASTLNLSVSATSISGTLSSGTLQVSYPSGVGVTIATPDDTVKTEHDKGGSFGVTVTSAGTNVISEKGVVRYNNGQTLAGKQDDDDDDHDHDDWTWIAIVAGGAAVAGLIIYIVARDEDEDVVSPVR